MKVKRLHRMLFSARTATATGILHVAGHRGGDELTFKLSRPRYNAARRTVSYKIKRLGDGRLPSRAAQAAGAARRFGPASLSMVGAQQGSVTVQQNTYGCANTDPSNPTCWGVLYASGLQANGGLFVNVSFSDGSTQQCDYSGFIDGSGNVQNPPRIPPTPVHERRRSRCHDHQRPGKGRRKRPVHLLGADLAPIWLRGRMTFG
jgi:hypothetical protein